VVRDGGHALLAGTVSATVERVVRLDPVPHDLAAAVIAHRGQAMNGALEAVEGMRLSRSDDLEGQVVLVATDFTGSHGEPPCNEQLRRCHFQDCPRNGLDASGSAALRGLGGTVRRNRVLPSRDSYEPHSFGNQPVAAARPRSRKNPKAKGSAMCPEPGRGLVRLRSRIANGNTADARIAEIAKPVILKYNLGPVGGLEASAASAMGSG